MRKILLVDDETIILYVLSSYLKSWNYEVITEPDSRKVIEMLESRERFDVMVSDIRMHPVNGIELLKISKQLIPDMPVILITGFGSHDIFKQAETLGAYKCLAKPFEPETLLKTIEEALTTKESTQTDDPDPSSEESSGTTPQAKQDPIPKLESKSKITTRVENPGPSMKDNKE